ncbi:MAG: hypothetical protein AAF902_17275 [Chloroflexota bacterium]
MGRACGANCYRKRLDYHNVPLVDKYAVRPSMVIARKPTVAVCRVESDKFEVESEKPPLQPSDLSLLTSSGWATADLGKLAEPDDTTKSQALIKTKSEQHLLCM